MSHPLALVSLFIVFATSACIARSPQASTSSPSITKPTAPPPAARRAPAENIFEKAARLGRGINLGNALEAPREGEWGVTLRDEDFSLVAAAGLQHVRVPIRWSAHTAEKAPYEIDPQFLARVDWVVGSSLEQGLSAIINVHHYEEMTQKPEAHTPRLRAMWRQIAEYFADYPEEVYFELFNEPHSALTARKNNELIADLLAVVRASNPERAVIVGGTHWNSFHGLSELELPASDKNLIVTFHYYDPFDFTHQGAPWANKQDAVGIDWPGSVGTETDIVEHFTTVAEWGKAQGRPIYLGEFGVYSAADMAARARWTRVVAEQAAKHGFPSAYWELRAGFGAYDSSAEAWHEPLLRALLPEVD